MISHPTHKHMKPGETCISVFLLRQLVVSTTVWNSSLRNKGKMSSPSTIDGQSEELAVTHQYPEWES